ncbi:MAG: allantoinase AllB [Actinomycetota bacterium]|nr:allantoinase AllB [Actinomycetota bacterium]
MSENEFDLVIRARRLVGPYEERSASVGVRDGVIAAIEPFEATLHAPVVVELGEDEVLLPGLVDSHVHVNDPGRTEWEGFASATRAAAAGGVTTLIDMPLNSIPPTVDVSALDLKRKTAVEQSYIDVGFWGGAIPGNVAQLRPLHEAGVFGFKCFLLHSGVEEFPHLDAAELELAMQEVASFDGLLIVHAEDARAIDTAPPAHGPHYADFLSSRPRRAEDLAIGQVIELARRTGCRAHILHLSSSDALPMIAAARAEGMRLTVETCPHYLCFSAEDIPDGATPFKCCPPIREGANRDELWRGLAEGIIETIVSDHSPSTVELKRLDTGDFGDAWGGVSSLQLGLPAVWTEARRRGFTLSDVVRWMCAGPATQTALRGKGAVAVGRDADFCVLAPEESFVVDAHKLQHRNAVTPYAGQTLKGVVRSAWLRGERVDNTAPPRGRLLARGDA